MPAVTTNKPAPYIGTAGWAVPKAVANFFGEGDSVLARYATIFNCCEINTTFYRRHKPETYEKWARSVPEDFRFSVKLPRLITHVARLNRIEEEFSAFLDDTAHLGNKRGPLLCQLPPDLAFEPDKVSAALDLMQTEAEGTLVLEPRHSSWTSLEAEKTLAALRIERVFADPPVIDNQAPSDSGYSYLRLHGKPHVYYSPYTQTEIADYAGLMSSGSWCVFDNTALGNATENALTMKNILSSSTL
ncbi:DUF72 domain-containing protein [Allorhizobium taibaishanense]|uniref:DUF72 domain-containing protein n=1 Tax=Allorhizobium taibaishanense TaxID=887144 RepID=A0A1Q9A6M7_9HYPH|nr:DUF72 domain-containing protein [Allorhizobium taibaishanense]OLP50236.1 hypothetical protein BJF91_12990 [Allorhizobium taibaishanense]